MKSSDFRVSQPRAGWPPRLVLGYSRLWLLGSCPASPQVPSLRYGVGGGRLVGGRPFPGQKDPLEFNDAPTPAAHLGFFKAS